MRKELKEMALLEKQILSERKREQEFFDSLSPEEKIKTYADDMKKLNKFTKYFSVEVASLDVKDGD